jgi:hypothetical protein
MLKKTLLRSFNVLKICPIFYHACTRVDFTELKKGFLDWKLLWYMVGREQHLVEKE